MVWVGSEGEERGPGTAGRGAAGPAGRGGRWGGRGERGGWEEAVPLRGDGAEG